jgi:hypothetical protein
MLPHPHGEAMSISEAFAECSAGFRDLRDEDCDDSARQWVNTIREYMDTSGIDDSSGRGTWRIKAEGMSLDEKYELSAAVDELAHWFSRRFWGEGD